MLGSVMGFVPYPMPTIYRPEAEEILMADIVFNSPFTRPRDTTFRSEVEGAIELMLFEFSAVFPTFFSSFWAFFK